ncbi:MAG: energy-coupling factor ABC transporter ATP-binding protein, partial [Halobacteria archaeon]
MSNMIKARNLTHRYGDYVAVDDVSFSIEKSEFIGLVGRNGCGKTTLVRHLNGLLEPTEGEVFVNGYKVSENQGRARRDVGYVFQNPESQIIAETVGNEVAFGPKNLGLETAEIEERVSGALEVVGMEEKRDRHPGNLSGGEKQLLAIAGVIAMKPEAIILDEPFSNLDYPSVKKVLARIRELNRDGMTVLVITHDLSKLYGEIDSLLVMEDGVIADRGGVDEVELERYGVRKPYQSVEGTRET